MSPLLTAAWAVSLLANESAVVAAAAEVRPLQVDVVVVGELAADAQLGERIQSWFGNAARVTVSWRSTLEMDDVLASRSERRAFAWVTLPKRGLARIFFAVYGEQGSEPRYLFRDVPMDRDFDEMGSERVAQIVHSSISAMREGLEGSSRPEIEAKLARSAERAPASRTDAKKDSAAAETRQRSPWVLEVSYRVMDAGDEGVAQGPGVALGMMGSVGTLHLGATLRGEYLLPRARSFESVSLKWQGGAARLAARSELDWGAIRAGLELGPGLAWVSYEPSSRTQVTLRSSGAEARPFGFINLGVSHGWRPLRIGLRAELDVYPTYSHYDVASEGTYRELAAASMLQPSLLLELGMN